MTKFIAVIALMAAQTAVSLGNYWYTFGLWPKSWVSFVGFFLATLALLALHLLIDREK